MNKLFNKLRKNRGLSMFLALAMLISLLPFDTVLANTASGNDAAAFSTRAADPTVTKQRFSSCYTDDTSKYSNVFAAATYTAPGAHKGLIYDVANHDYNTCGKLVIDITPSRDGMMLILEDQSGTLYSNDNMSGQTTIELDLTRNVQTLTFKVDSDGTGAVYSGDAITVIINSLTFVNTNAGSGDTPSGGDTSGGGNTPEGGDTSEGGGNTETTVVPTATGISELNRVTDVTNDNAPAFAAVSFTHADKNYYNFNVDVENHDINKYSVAEIVVTSGRDNMPLGIYCDQGCFNGWYQTKITGKKTITLNLKDVDSGKPGNITAFTFYLEGRSDVEATNANEVFTIHSIKFIDPNAPAEPTGPVVIDMPLSNESKTYETMSDDGKTITMTEQNDFRARVVFPADFKVEAGKVLTINYETNITGLTAYFCWGSGTEKITEELSTTEKSISFVIDDAFIEFFNNNTSGQDTMLRFKLNGAKKDTWFTLNSVTYGDPKSEEDDVPTTSSAPSWTAPGGPTVTLDMASTGYSFEVNEDGSVDVTYEAGWSELNFSVTEFDPAVCKELRIDITPSWDGMNLGVTDQTKEVYFLNHWGPNIVEEDIRHTITVPMPKEVTKGSVTGLKFFCDPYGNETVTQPTGPQTFTIHSVKIVDPTMPDGEVVKAELSVQEHQFTQPSPDTIQGVKGDKMRGMICLPLDFKVKEGMQLTFLYDTNLDIDTVQLAYGYDGFNDDMNVTWDAAEKSYSYIIDENWVKFINENTTGKKPTLRLKVDAIPKDGYFTLKYVVYGEQAEKYDPNQVPQGLAVTYYDDIYSRGVAWNTDDTVPASALYYIKSDGTMTADTVEWEKATPVNATKKAYTAKQDAGKTSKVWHTFKAVVKDLEPGATYFYRAGSEEYGWSKVGTFNVEVAEDKIDSLHFIYVTDTQEEQQSEFKKYAKLVADAYSRMPNADYLAHTGDLVNRGESEDEMHMEEWMYVLDEPKEQLMNSVLMPTVGNHDCGSFVFTDRFAIDWADYKEDSTDDLKTGGCYTFTYGKPENGVFVISLNTNDGWTDFTPLRTWMEEQLKAHNDYKWKIVQMHAGAMTAGDHAMDGESKALRKDFSPLFAKYKVDLVLQGHDHVYTRTRSMYYGDNPFEEGTQYYDGHTPVYLSAVKETRTVNGKSKEVYIEPQGTHYITINASGGKTYPEEPAEALDPVIVESEGENPINPKDEDGNFGSIAQPGKPMYALISIEGDLLNFEAYTYSSSGSELYDTFAVDKSSDRGYTLDTINDGKTEVQLYGIKVEGKKYDGHPVKLDLTGFNCSEPSIMDTASLKYNITTVSGGVDPVTKEQYVFHPSNLIYGMMPKEPGTYHMTISVPKTNKYFYGEVVFDFTITE